MNIKRAIEELLEKNTIVSPGLCVFVGKFHPFHNGHLSVIEHTLRDPRVDRVLVYVSNKEPNLEANTYKQLGAAWTKRETLACEFTHPFSVQLRVRLIHASLPKEWNVSVIPGNIGNFWKKISSIGSDEQVLLVGGNDRSSYDKHPNIQQIVIPEQGENLRGKYIRQLISEYLDGDKESKRRLLSLVPWPQRLLPAVRSELEKLVRKVETIE